MDFHPPQGAHTSHLRTLSKIKSLRASIDPAPLDLSSEGAAYYTTISQTVNTFVATFWFAARRKNAVGIFVAAGRFGRGIEGARILSGRIGFGKGFGELFLIRSPTPDEAVFR